MIGRTVLAAAVIAACAGVAQGNQDAPAKRPQVEVVFVLDTTGSMGGLIEGAKKKIWSIAGEIARGKPSPDLRVGLVAYRDKGDAYVTKVTALTEDLDKVYAELTGFQAQGGGDHPENVRQAVHDALTRIAWSKEKGTLRILFLVGDAPPHMDYTDVPAVEALCKSACEAGVIINAIRCGGDGQTGKVWQEMARLAEGEYFSIDQTGGVVAVATPFDKELGELSDKLGTTVLAFGEKEKKAAVALAEGGARDYADDTKAARAAAKAYAPRVSEADLVDAVRENRVKLEEVKEEQLPEALKKLSAEERKAHVEKLSKEREEIRARIVEVSKKRDAYVAGELKKRGTKDSFDEVVLKALQKQGEKKGIRFENK